MYKGLLLSLILAMPFLLKGGTHLCGTNGLYVSGDYMTSADKAIFKEFVLNNGFDYLLLYNYDLSRPDELGAFIKELKLEAGVQSVAAITVLSSQFQPVISFNSSRANALERFDVINYEVEFWNHAMPSLGYCNLIPDQECTRENFFEYYLGEIQLMDSLTLLNGMKSEVYIGWPTANEAAEIAKVVDRVLVHYYRQNDVDLINYGIERLENLAHSDSSLLEIMPIFSSEGPSNTADLPFMGDWLNTNPIDKAYESWIKQYEDLNFNWKNNLSIGGATWFMYERFSNKHTNHITKQPRSKELAEEGFALFVVNSSAQNKGFQWYKNGKCLSNSNSIAGVNTAVLRINPVDELDSGYYSCKVISYDSINPGQFQSEKALLTVIPEQSPYKGDYNSIPGLILAKNYDRGGQNIAYSDLDAQQEGGVLTYRTGDGVDFDSSSANGVFVSHFEATEWLEYSIISQSETNYMIGLDVKAVFNSTVHIELDGIEVSGPIEVTADNLWGEVQIPLSIKTGLSVFKIHVDEGNVQINEIEFNILTSAAALSAASTFIYQGGILSFSESIKSISVFDVTGKLLLSKNNSKNIDLRQYSKGILIVKADNNVFKL